MPLRKSSSPGAPPTRVGRCCVGRCLAAMAASLLALALVLPLAPGGTASALDETFNPIGDWVGDDGLTGSQIYDRVIANRFDASTQLMSLSSKDRAGYKQYVEMESRYLRGAEDDDVIARTIAKYTRPLDTLHMGYLVINKRRGPDDQFVYLPSSRSVRRINARTESISGTDFTLEDIVPAEAEDAAHYRMPDTEYKGVPAWVVTVVPHEDTRSAYSKFVVTIEKQRGVPLQTEYWDDRGVRIKELRADPRSIEMYTSEDRGAEKRIWIVRRSKMMHLKRGSQTVLNILDFVPSPELTVRDFSQRELTAGR